MHREEEVDVEWMQVKIKREERGGEHRVCSVAGVLSCVLQWCAVACVVACDVAHESTTYTHMRCLSSSLFLLLQVLSDINRSLARKDVELQLQEKEHYKKELELSERRDELKTAIQSVEGQAQKFLEDKDGTTKTLQKQREELDEIAQNNEELHKKRMDDFEGTLAEAISNQMHDRDESIAQKSAKIQQQKRELAQQEKEVSKLSKKIAEHEHELINRQEALEESKQACEKLSQELEEVSTDLSTLKASVQRESGERVSEGQRKQKEDARLNRETEVADKKSEQQHQREQKAMKLNMAHKFPDPEEGLEFKIEKVRKVFGRMEEGGDEYEGATSCRVVVPCVVFGVGAVF